MSLLLQLVVGNDSCEEDSDVMCIEPGPLARETDALPTVPRSSAAFAVVRYI